MTLSIVLGALKSRLAREAASVNGVRTFIWSALTTPITPGGIASSLKTFGGIAKGFLIAQAISTLSSGLIFSFTAIWGMLIRATQFIWNFNWNATDKDLNASIKSAYNALGSTAGSTVGSALGYLLCGGLPTTLIASFNEPLALHIFDELGEEALQEVSGNLGILVRQTSALALQTAATFFYTNARSILRDSSDVFRSKLVASGVNKDKLEKAVQDYEKPWSFASKTEETIESIPNEFFKNFTEELVEEFSDSCIESGYIIASGIDSYLASAKAAYGGTLGDDELVEILIGRKSATPAP